MNLIQRHVPFLFDLYMLIAPPRVRRLIYFVIYACLGFAGLSVFFNPPRYLANTLGGYVWIWTFGSFIVLGAIICLIAVLPGIWWFERAGLAAIMTGITLYAIILLYFGASILVLLFPLIVILICTLRLLDIKEFLLEPKEG